MQAPSKHNRHMARIDMTSLGAYIKEQRTSAELSIRELAKVTGLSNPYLSQIERGIRQPSAQTLSRVADALRISAEQLYVRAGFLDRNHESSARDAIAADPHLTNAQRTLLIELYDEFVTAAEPSAKPAAAKSATKSTAKKTTAKPTTTTPDHRTKD